MISSGPAQPRQSVAIGFTMLLCAIGSAVLTIAVLPKPASSRLFDLAAPVCAYFGYDDCGDVHESIVIALNGAGAHVEAAISKITALPVTARTLCLGPSEAIDRFDKQMYRRTIISSEVLGNEEEGIFCHITLQMCKDETALTQGLDFGYGDYYRLQATPEWCSYTGTPDYTYAGMSGCEDARSYSPVNPMNENTAQFIIKKDGPYPDDYGCTAGKDCKFGFSELACMLPVGSEVLMSASPDHSADPDSTHYAYKSNVNRECGNGPYIINVIGQGVAITETHPLGMSKLLDPILEDGCVSTIKEVNFLWANSYWCAALPPGPIARDLSALTPLSASPGQARHGSSKRPTRPTSPAHSSRTGSSTVFAST